MGKKLEEVGRREVPEVRKKERIHFVKNTNIDRKREIPISIKLGKRSSCQKVKVREILI